MKFIGTKSNGQLLFPPPVAEMRKKYWDGIKEDTIVEESLVVKRESKTNKQLGAYWKLAMAMAIDELDYRGYDTSFILKTDKPTGIKITKDLLCDFFYNICPIFNDDSQIITLSKATTTQAAKFFDDTRNYLASQWSIYVPEPDPEWRTKLDET